MLSSEIINALILVWCHKTVRISVFLIICLSFLLSIFFSVFASVIIITCYLTGYVVSFCLIKYRYEVGFCLHRLASIYHGHLTPKKNPKQACTICDNLNCARHEPSVKEPWKTTIISNELNQAIEDFYNKILENFVTSWYGNLTDDETFLNELRVTVKFATASIINRYKNINLGILITNKLIPCALRHIHDYIKIKEKVQKDKAKLEIIAVEYFGKRLHAAVTTRENELGYLRNLTTCLLPQILPKAQLNCNNFNILIREILAGWVLLPMMDVIADPGIINLLVNITVNYKKKNHTRIVIENNTDVELLCNFTNYKNVKKAALGHDLSRILKSPEMLYAFMQFLKEEGPVNVLQYCLDIEEFNKKLLTPDLSTKELEKLHTDAVQIYEVYLNENSSDSIECPFEIRSSVRYLLQSGPQNVTKLRTSTPLYKSYDYAFSLLENKWLPLFYHSEEFYKMACGPRITSNYHKLKVPGNKRAPEQSSQGAVSKISSGFHRIKGALRTPQPVDGAVYHVESQTFESVPSLFIEQNIYRDLSTWRVSIDNVEQGAGPKPLVKFNVNVKRIDACSESDRSWNVYRHDQDFYTLKIKLVEFHGENEICDSPLPSRRSTTPLETRRQKYEEFLQKLLQKPSLRGSDLLHTFLTTNQNFTLLADTSMPIVSDLGNIYQSVATKLRKEKGQHLDSFMATFLQTTEVEKAKSGKPEIPDVGEEVKTDVLQEGNEKLKTRNLKNSVFGNNFDVPFPDTSAFRHMSFSPSDIIQCTSYLLSHIFHASHAVLRLFTAICSVAHDALEYLCRIIIEHQIKASLSEHTLAHLINLLQDVLFYQKFVSPTKTELEQRKQTAFQNITKIRRGFFSYWLGIEVNKGLTTLLEILQLPQLNKQLAYSLLDIIILELYPDCNLNKSTKNN